MGHQGNALSNVSVGLAGETGNDDSVGTAGDAGIDISVGTAGETGIEADVKDWNDVQGEAGGVPIAYAWGPDGA